MLPIWQTPFVSQHPPAHVEGPQGIGLSHACAEELQLSGATHAAHALPPPPHAALEVPATHSPSPLQHPFGQLEALHAW